MTIPTTSIRYPVGTRRGGACGFQLDKIESIDASRHRASLERAKKIATTWPERAIPGSIAPPVRQVVVASNSISTREHSCLLLELE
jgi:hypothetical protein